MRTSFRRTLAACFAGAVVIGSGIGQALADNPYPTCAREPKDEEITAAKGLHEAAKSYYDTGAYQQAIDTWMSAYRFDCHAHPLLINIGNAYEKLAALKPGSGMIERAVEAFDTYVQRMGKDADPTVVEKVKNLKAQLEPKPQPPPTPPVPVPVPVPDPVTPDGGKVNVPPLVVAGIGGAMLLTGVIVAPVGASKVSDAEAVCPIHDQCFDENAKTTGNQGRTMVAAGAAVAGIGGAALVGGLVWYFVTAGQSEAPPQTQFVPFVAPSVAGALFSSRF